MNNEFRPAFGTCRCGRVQFRIAAPPIITMACHCTGCQRMSASAFSLSAAIPGDGFSVSRGEPVIGGLHGELRHFFCAYCMSWLFTRIPGDAFVNVRITMLEDPKAFPPYIDTCHSQFRALSADGGIRRFGEGLRDPCQRRRRITSGWSEP
jgi:hypothetical protein